MYGRDITPEMLAYLTNGDVDEDDIGSIITCCDEANIHQDEEMYFIIGYYQNAVEIFGCLSRDSLMILALYFRVFLLTSPSILFRGVIQNPKELPYKVENDNTVTIIFADHSIQMFYSMNKTTEHIEDHLRKYTASDIDDFVVIIGEELEFDIGEWNATVRKGTMSHGAY